MYATYFVFLMIWLAYVWVWRDMNLKPHVGKVSIRTDAPTFRSNCSTKKVPCIDDCSFLCVEKDVQCVGGVCQPEAQLNQIPCNAKKGGVLMMVEDPVPHWSCICTDSRFFRGEDCETLNPDVCEHGMFTYKDRKNYLCICLPPYELVVIGTKPHCIEKKLLGFYDEFFMKRG